MPRPSHQPNLAGSAVVGAAEAALAGVLAVTASVEAAAVGRAPACVELVASLDIGAARGRCGEGRHGEEGGEEDGDELELHFGDL